MIKIIVVEDYSIMRSGIRSMLEKEDDIIIIGETSTERDTLKLLEEGEQPDVVLMGITLPKAGGIGSTSANGIHLLTRITQVYPAIKVIILTILGDKKYIAQAFGGGAVGYILKNVDILELLFGIRHVHLTNKRYICNELSISFLDEHLNKPESIGVNLKTISISVRDIKILALLSEGFTNQEIADTLLTSKRTIESQRLGLIEKTGVRNTAALIRYAIENDLLS